MNDGATAALEIRHAVTAVLAPALLADVKRLCRAAYGEDLDRYFVDIGPGDHLLGFVDGVLVSHLMWVPRTLKVGGGAALRTAYVELVATAPDAQGRGYATALLERFAGMVGHWDLAALSPATYGIYSRLGWRLWQGPLSIRTSEGGVPTPDEEVMVLLLPRTPPLAPTLPLSAEWRPGEIW